MKRIVFITFVALAICSSCSDSYCLSETEQALAQLDNEYENAKSREKKSEGEDDTEKIETLANEAEIKTSLDEYMSGLMNRSSIAKERVMRTAYSSVANVVGVLKINSCGSYKELSISMDCEDKKQKSHTTGDVGASFVDGSGNVNLVFCLTNANRYYPGGVLLVNHINYSMSFQGPSYPLSHQVNVFVNHHDAEDNNPSHYVKGTDDYYNIKEHFGGYTKIDNDVTLAWGFPRVSSFNLGNYYGAPGIEYGLLSTTLAATGTIYCDDEDNHNANWIQRYIAGATLDGGFTATKALSEYGVTTEGNTIYSVSLSTDPKFREKNIYYSPRLIFN